MSIRPDDSLRTFDLRAATLTSANRLDLPGCKSVQRVSVCMEPDAPDPKRSYQIAAELLIAADRMRVGLSRESKDCAGGRSRVAATHQTKSNDSSRSQKSALPVVRA